MRRILVTNVLNPSQKTLTSCHSSGQRKLKIIPSQVSFCLGCSRQSCFDGVPITVNSGTVFSISILTLPTKHLCFYFHFVGSEGAGLVQYTYTLSAWACYHYAKLMDCACEPVSHCFYVSLCLGRTDSNTYRYVFSVSLYPPAIISYDESLVIASLG